MIVLSTDTAVKDLLDKRSAIYSDRPDMFIGQKIASGDLRLVVMVRCFRSRAGAGSYLYPVSKCPRGRAKQPRLTILALEIRRYLANGPQDGS